MDYQKRLEELEAEKNRILSIQAHCEHVWGQINYDPEKKEIIRSIPMMQGVDMYFEHEHTGIYEEIPRWSRKCVKCGFVEYTKEQEYETVSRGPRFRGR